MLRRNTPGASPMSIEMSVTDFVISLFLDSIIHLTIKPDDIIKTLSLVYRLAWFIASLLQHYQGMATQQRLQDADDYL